MKNHRKLKLHPGIKILLVVVALFTAFKLISLQMQINSLQQQSAELDKQISRKQLENQELQESLSEGVTDESIAKIARDVLGYASPGERSFIDGSKQ